MTRHLQSDALILKSTRMGDTHRIIVLFSPELGIIRAAAFGSRKGSGKLTGLVSPFISGRFFLYHNPVKDQYKIEDVRPVAFREYLQSDIVKLYTASFFAEVVLKSFSSGGDNQRLYELITTLLDLLEQDIDHEYLLIQGCWRLLDMFGLKPDLLECASCGTPFEKQPSWIHLNEHGLWCSSCYPAQNDSVRIGFVQRRYLSYTETLSVDRAVKVKLNSDQTQQLKNTLLHYIDSLTDGYLKTLKSGML